MQYIVGNMLPMMNFQPFIFTLLCGVVLVSCGVNRETRLHQAVTFVTGNGKSADVRRLLDAGADVNSRDAKGCTPLLNAYGIGCDVFEYEPCHEDAVASLKMLLDAGADVNARTTNGLNALDLALRHFDNEPIVGLLRERGLKASTPEYELVWHARHNHVAEVKRLLADGVSPNAHSADGESALWATMPCFNVKPHAAECMDLLLAAGADVNELQDGRSLLDMALIFAGEEMEKRYVNILRRHGAVMVRPPCWH